MMMQATVADLRGQLAAVTAERDEARVISTARDRANTEFLRGLAEMHQTVKAERDEAREVLRSVEWAGESMAPDGSDRRACLMCREWQTAGHAPGCKLDAALPKSR